VTEATLTRALVKVLRAGLPGAVVIKHADRFTAGVPDLSVTWGGRTTWLEVKYANPRLLSRGIQDLTMRGLARAGSAYYVVYFASGETCVAPDLGPGLRNPIRVSPTRHDHKIVVEFVRIKHER